jgi:hypothetical protein
MNESVAINRIKTLVKTSLPKLSPHLREWAEQHIIPPRQVSVALLDDGREIITLWLVTDHTGQHDSSSRVVFDDKKEKFGLEMTLANGVHWFMGLYGEFAKTVESM